ncbi:MAG: AMP-binding protein [Acidimicrobiales bacterium]|nr:AMP-binding protein [Acidimicrobiales bacterium]
MHSAYELIAAAASRTPGQPALVDDLTGLSFTYGELLDEVDAVAAALAERGVARGMRFATVLPNNIEHCLTILALARLGAVPALMNARLTPGELAQLMEQAGVVGALLVPDPTLVAATREVVGSSGTVLCAGGATEGAEAFGECRGDVDGLPPVPEVERDELAYIFYTSGTTGLPKGVLLCHKTTLPRIVWISALTGVRAGTHIRTLGLAPLSHAIGFYGNFLMSLAYSGTYFTSSTFDPESVLSCIERNEISLVFTVPTFYFALMSAPGYRPERLSSIRNLMWGGATIRPDLLRLINEDLDVTTSHLYGTTETMVSLYNHAPGDEPTRLRPGLFSSVRLVEFGGGADDLVEVGEEGELLISAASDAIFDGYLEMPDATAEKIRDGWYHTGDTFRLRQDGDLEYSGRMDDIIRSGGENIHPDEVEAALSNHPEVSDVGVVGFPDDYWGEMVVACVVSEDAASVGELDSWCREGPLAAYKRPRGYLFMESLPRNAANKLLRTELRKLGLGSLQRI